MSSPWAQDSRTSALKSQEPSAGDEVDSVRKAEVHVDLWAVTQSSKPRGLSHLQLLGGLC